MPYKIVDNPDGCASPRKRGERTCTECYYSQVDEHSNWTGSEQCWKAQCLTLKYAMPIR